MDEKTLKQLYIDDQLSTTEIARKYNQSSSNIEYWLKKYHIPRRTMSEALKLAHKMGRAFRNIKRGNERKPYALSGERSPTWKGGRSRNGKYPTVMKKNHPRADKNGYVLEHILVWEQAHNASVPPGYVIHHLNGLPDDNRPANLLALPNKKHYLVLAAKAKRIQELEALLKQQGQLV
ncbi:HNH endonuclease [Patescibacteria group bacterium]|uniref:Putative homing endonuclease n=1 Tax=viral metagenome TaxID=1070528 RepID=A0A6M3M9P0_9ZZZZ|nr:HNH endonuclease [Patescibacteria group bacterium]